ncbi:hypothetical protein MASR2M50_09880 [Thauera sp.]
MIAGAISLPSVDRLSSGRPKAGISCGMPPKRLPMVSTGNATRVFTAVMMISTASGPGSRRIQAVLVAWRFHATRIASDTTATATVGRCRVGSAAASAPILAKNSPGRSAICRPRKSLICEMKITTAMPLVKPITTDSGMKRIMLPRRSAPMANSSTPDIIVAMSRFCTPWSTTIAYTMGMKAPVGPPICTREPPRKAIRKPATIAVQIPAVGDMPLAIANAIASGRASTPTVMPEERSPTKVARP